MEHELDRYTTMMCGIAEKVAIQAIRKILRDKELDDIQKLTEIVTVVHSFEGDKQADGNIR